MYNYLVIAKPVQLIKYGGSVKSVGWYAQYPMCAFI